VIALEIVERRVLADNGVDDGGEHTPFCLPVFVCDILMAAEVPHRAVYVPLDLIRILVLVYLLPEIRKLKNIDPQQFRPSAVAQVVA
jgi:hypothetical protein